MGVTQIPPRAVNLLSDSQSVAQQDSVGGVEDELSTAFPKQLSGRIDGAKIECQPTEDLEAIAKSAIRPDIRTVETMVGASEAARQKIFALVTAGEALRKEQPRTQMPAPSRPHFPEVEIDGTSAGHPTLKNVGQSLPRPKKLRIISRGRKSRPMRLSLHTKRTQPRS